MRRIFPWLVIPLAIVLLLLIAYLPLPVQPYLDFQVAYHAAMGLQRGIPLYDHAGQVAMIAEIAGVQADRVFVLPFPYPPWYALSMLPLAFLPIDVAARLWLELNVIMLLLSTWILTHGWRPWKRLVSFLLVLTFLPVLGALIVGQYVFPVLLGISLFVHAIRQKSPFLTALAAALMTFKPHLGAMALLAGLVHLSLRRDSFRRRALGTMTMLGGILVASGFLADPLWPINYFKSLANFRLTEGVASCDLCTSLPIMLANLIGSSGNQVAFWISGIFLLIVLVYFFWKNQEVWHRPGWLTSTFVLVTLLISPYLLNYDFVLLLVPLFMLAGAAQTRREWSLAIIVFILPWLGLGFYQREGNIALVLSTLALSGWLFQKLDKNQLDSPIPDMYNQKKSLREE